MYLIISALFLEFTKNLCIFRVFYGGNENSMEEMTTHVFQNMHS